MQIHWLVHALHSCLSDGRHGVNYFCWQCLWWSGIILGFYFKSKFAMSPQTLPQHNTEKVPTLSREEWTLARTMALQLACRVASTGHLPLPVPSALSLFLPVLLVSTLGQTLWPSSAWLYWYTCNTKSLPSSTNPSSSGSDCWHAMAMIQNILMTHICFCTQVVCPVSEQQHQQEVLATVIAN